MSNYTTQIRFICESKSGLTESAGFSGIEEAIENSVDDIFSFDWPIFDENYRVPLEIKILRHFYTREIGEETFGLWQLRLCDRLNVIMPYYNQLYKSELIKFNPMYDVDLTTEHERANDGLVSKNGNTVYNINENSNRDNTRMSTDDGISDTDSVGSMKSKTNEENNETTSNSNTVDKTESGNENISNVNTNTETSKSENINTMNGTQKNNSNSSNVGNSDEKAESSSDNSRLVDERNNSNRTELMNSYENSKVNGKEWKSNITSGNSVGEGTRDNKNVNRYSDTPQGNVSIGGGPNDGNASSDSVFGNGYLTNVTIVDDYTQTDDKRKTENLSDETGENISNQSVSRNQTNDDSLEQIGHRNESGSETGTKRINRSNTSDEVKEETVDKTETNNGIVDQNIKSDGTSDETRNRESSVRERGDNFGERSGIVSAERKDDRRDKTNSHTSNLHNSNENEKFERNGEHTENVTGRVKNFSTEDFIQRVQGKRGGLTYSKMLDEFRKTFLNIDRMILNDLEPLFIGLWE